MIGKRIPKWDRKIFCSLRAKILYVLLLAGGCSILLFWGGYKLTNYLISNFYLQEDVLAKRTLNDSHEFQEFITKKNLSSADTEEIAKWTLKKNDIDLLFYRDNQFAFEIGWGGIYQDSPNSDYTENPDYTHFQIQFSDGPMKVVILDYSEYHLYDLSNLILLILCCLLFVLFSLLYTNKMIHTIITLSQEVNEIGNGNLEKQIHIPGRDELSLLAADIDQMRQSILSQMQSEQNAWQANSDLITAISHDIRTPLTALIGYLDLAVGGQYNTPEQLAQYLSVSQGKAMQLKSLTDELFQYFLVFGRNELSLDMKAFDAPVALQQLLGERIIQLQMNGFRCTEKPLNEKCEIITDISYLKRVLDNLFTNIEKHADPSQPVVIQADRKDHYIHIYMINQIPEVPASVESTKIGLQTCEKIMFQLNGYFEVEQIGRRFSAEVIIPCRDTRPATKKK